MANSGTARRARQPPDDALPAEATSAEYRPAYCPEVDETAVVTRYVPVVKRIALNLKGRLPETVQLDDLIQAGLIAVLRILRRGGIAELGSPALRQSIRNAMIDEARHEIWAPVRTVRLAKAAAQAMRTVRQRLGRDGSDEEIAAALGIALAEYHTLLVEIAGIRLLPIDDFDESDDTLPLVDGVQDAALDRDRLAAALAGAIASLPEREKLVVSLYYEQELNMEEVGKILGFDKSTVCRAHGRALLMLRDALSAWRSGEAPLQPIAGE